MAGALAASQRLPDEREVLDELPEGELALLVFLHAKQSRRMQCGEDVGRERALDELAALQRNLEILADDRPCRRGAEGDDDVRLHGGDLALEPLVAGIDLAL